MALLTSSKWKTSFWSGIPPGNSVKQRGGAVFLESVTSVVINYTLDSEVFLAEGAGGGVAKQSLLFWEKKINQKCLKTKMFWTHLDLMSNTVETVGYHIAMYLS
jgi:hypothetical protein